MDPYAKKPVLSHPARRLRHGDRPTEPLTFEDEPAAPLRQALVQIERLAREGTRDGHLIRDAIQEIAGKALAPKPDPVRTKLLDALCTAESLLKEFCQGQHPDNVCCHELRAIQATIAEASAP